VAEKMGLGKTFITVAAAMLCKFVTEQVVMGLPLSILWGTTLEESGILPHNDLSGIVSEEWDWYRLQILNCVPRHLLEIQPTPPHGHPALVTVPEPIMVVRILGAAESFKTVINMVTHGSEFKLGNLLHSEYAKLTNEDRNTSIDKPETR
jgi:hypothetical protein